MRFNKIISTVFHPIVIPTVGVIIYFLISPLAIERNQKLVTLILIFGATYILPLLLLILLKKFNLINSYQLKSKKERRIPIGLMVLLFYGLGNLFSYVDALQDLSLLFYATSIGLIITYILLHFNIKSSIHLLSIGISCGFFMLLSYVDNRSYMPIIIIIFLIAGLLASARLHLKAHTPKEVYLGFFIGIGAVFGLYWLL
ncbi:hypothetical protein [Polaribacter sp. MED152]|uniref:hypothetical protein n=1 Tax=Polaribacter sp. MED152 TaxID=313598 RepID=UPI000186F494|nr:hypothetical protein [Polaribacter sp. MED152]EAQ43234.2 hypothetical protein MED152_10930 [Polaribacter sp. MED152]